MAKLNIPPMPEGLTWTSDQWKAITAKGQDTLVAAAAGSGKTAVLVERIIRKITDCNEPLNVDELLVATFTNASAAEMRHRIGVALEEAIDKDPKSPHLKMQLSLLNRASISTLHSFCLEVIRKYYYLIDIDPGFRIAEDTEGQLLKDEVMDDIFEEEYGKPENQAFFRLVDTFTNDRTDEALKDIILDLYEFSRANPSPDCYLSSIVDMYDAGEETEVAELPFMKNLLFDIRLQLNGAKEMLNKGLELTKVPGGPAPRAENFLSDIHVVDTLLAALKESWKDLHDAMQVVEFERAKPASPKTYDKGLIDKAQKLRDKAKKIVLDIKEELFTRKPQSFLKDMAEMRPVIKTLVELVRLFSKRFDAVKQEKGLVDFSDLEHYTLSILAEGSDEKGNLLPSEAAAYYRRQFKEVLVDEYQDTNMVQEAILQLVTADGESTGNMFMVGDVKQSIYRFRLAEPNLFLGKYNRFKDNGEGTGLKIDLAKNFRSRNEVLEGTNYLFKQIMGITVGEIHYDEQAELKKGASYPEDEPFPVEVLLIESATPSEHGDAETSALEDGVFDSADLEQSQYEARVMAKEIKKMIGERRTIFNGKTGTSRPVNYRDIVILLRSMTWAPQIMEEFKLQGIPVYANLSTGYFEATEISIMLSLLKVIDNPLQDIPLASVLRSPIVGIDEEGMAKIRLANKRGAYFDALEEFSAKAPAEADESLQEITSVFLEKLKRWRTTARQGSVSELIWQLLRETGFYDFAGGMPGGKQRQANLRALYDRARQYESTSFRGLFRFLRFIDRMRERGNDLGTAGAIGEQEDVVRMMTIHSSKGLEFPVVFAAGLARNFNMMDLKKFYMLDKEFGFAAKYVNPEKRISYPSLPQIAFKRKKKLEMLAEEMRVLYVAMTRAKEKLYLLGSVKDAEKTISQWCEDAGSDWLLDEYIRASATSFMDWIGPAVMRHRDAGSYGDRQGPQCEVSEHPSKWKITIFKAEDAGRLEEGGVSEYDNRLDFVARGEKVNIESCLGKEAVARLSWRYGNTEATVHRAKQSVSELKRNQEARDEESGTEIVRRFSKPILNRPKFMLEKKMTPAEKGTAMHMVMQHIDLSEPITPQAVKELMNGMVDREMLLPEQKDAVEIDWIVHFFENKIGMRLLNAKNVNREVPFYLSFPSSRVYPGWKGEEEEIFIQGIIDCVFEDEHGTVLLDFKSDNIHERFKGGFQEAHDILKERYRLQISLYTEALEKVTRRKVDEKYLYFFDGGHLIDM
ncbi:helicase-exonuclease AddAB subunit AddA [Bacillus massilinigeriensis]|uniref:helicase-exonuclease AddAB subunit AddA n=1 Tax=Bacillus mediterraneensis TaxID=1805474 RepID=UPI0008F96793|nr:helicase-exonuclease AddAB subunit AddA [Bacillus mediterraneensis]